MGRNRTQLHLSSSQQTELAVLLKKSPDQRTKERLQFLKLATVGEHTLDELAGFVGRSRSTLQNWMEKFVAGGIPGLIERESPPGRQSPLADARIQRQLQAGLRSGQLKNSGSGGKLVTGETRFYAGTQIHLLLASNWCRRTAIIRFTSP